VTKVDKAYDFLIEFLGSYEHPKLKGKTSARSTLIDAVCDKVDCSQTTANKALNKALSEKKIHRWGRKGYEYLVLITPKYLAEQEAETRQWEAWKKTAHRVVIKLADLGVAVTYYRSAGVHIEKDELIKFEKLLDKLCDH